MWFIINKLASPKQFLRLSAQLMPWLIGLLIVSATYGLVGGLLLAPADAVQGDSFRIIYVHAPAAFLSIFIYSVMTVAAVMALVFRLSLAFPVIRHSARIGAGFTLLALITGSLWGKPMWGTWWIWDARLTSELILLFLYVGILLFRSATAHKTSGERALAILILVGAVDLPIIHYSVYWWNTLHQGATLNLFGRSSIADSMLYPLLAMIIAFLSYYTLLIFMHVRHDILLRKTS